MSRVRTGYERAIAHRSSSTYAYPAKEDGVVVDMDEKAKMIKIKYKDGSTDTIVYGEEYSQCSDMWVTQKMELTVKVGDKFKRGDILCYNKEFYQKDPYSRQVDWKHGTHANVLIMETNGTYEDSSAITSKFSEKLNISPVQVRTITINKDTIVHDIVKEGQHIEINDPLIVFEDSEIGDVSSIATNDETLAFISRLNRKIPKSKFSGTIVRIETFYACTPQEMHPSLMKIVKNLIKLKSERHKFSKDTINEANNPQPIPLPKDSKFRGITFDPETVIIQFYIKEEIGAGIGDKIVLDSSLKSVISTVIAENPISESGIPIDIIFSGTSIGNRIVNSPILVGTTQRVLEHIENKMIEQYFE